MKTFIFVLGLVAFGLAHGADRVALVIGNGAYRYTPSLPNPVNDATAVAAALRALSFEVVSGIDLDQLGIRNKMREFSQRLRGAKVGLFYYAGHGLQVNGRNYLVPVDAQFKDEIDLPYETVELSQVLSLIEKSTDTSLVFLDACRDNPLSIFLGRSMGLARSTELGRGLAQVRTGAGSLIAFATEPGNVAADGQGDHSPFTSALLAHIDTPGLDVAVMLRRVRHHVITNTNGKQVPWSNSSLTGDFYFAPRPPSTAPVPEQGEATKPSSAAKAGAESKSVEITFWNSVKESDDIDMFRAYLDKYPSGSFVPIAKLHINRLSRNTQQENRQPGSFPLSVRVTPSDARVRILNITPRYHDGILLKPGRYHIEVSRSGYTTHKRWVEIKAEPLTVSVDLADKVKRRWIGVMIQDVTPELAEAFGITRLEGALVADVTPDSPAAEAGIMAGDSIIRFDGGKVSKVSDLVSLVADAAVGKAVILEVIRSQISVEIVLRVGEWPEGKE